MENNVSALTFKTVVEHRLFVVYVQVGGTWRKIGTFDYAVDAEELIQSRIEQRATYDRVKQLGVSEAWLPSSNWYQPE